MPRGTSVVDAANIERRLWSPMVLNPIIWLDAADIGTLRFGTGLAVSTWNDKGSSRTSFDQATGANRPTLVENSQNFLSGVNFTGSHWLQGTSTIWSSPPINVFIVTKVNGGGYQGLIETAVNTGLGLGYSATGNYACFRSNAQDFPFNLGKVGTDILTYQTTGLDIATSSITVSFRRNGTAAATAQFLTGVATSTTTSVGAYLNGTNDLLNGLIYEIVVLNVLNPISRNKTEGYLAWKWGLTASLAADHPYKYQIPLIDIG